MKRESGHGLLLSLLVLVVMMTALGLLASSMRTNMQDDQRDFRTVSVIAMSDAVMAETLAHLAQNQDFPGVEERPFGKGLISSQVQPYGTWRVEIKTRVTYGEYERRMRALVSFSGSTPTVLSWRRTREESSASPGSEQPNI